MFYIKYGSGHGQVKVTLHNTTFKYTFDELIKPALAFKGRQFWSLQLIQNWSLQFKKLQTFLRPIQITHAMHIYRLYINPKLSALKAFSKNMSTLTIARTRMISTCPPHPKFKEWYQDFNVWFASYYTQTKFI